MTASASGSGLPPSDEPPSSRRRVRWLQGGVLVALLVVAIATVVVVLRHRTSSAAGRISTVHVAPYAVAFPRGWNQNVSPNGADPFAVVAVDGPVSPAGFPQGAVLRVAETAANLDQDVRVFISMQGISHESFMVRRQRAVSVAGAVHAVLLVEDFVIPRANGSAPARKMDVIGRRSDGSSFHLVEQADPNTLSDSEIDRLVAGLQV